MSECFYFSFEWVDSSHFCGCGDFIRRFVWSVVFQLPFPPTNAIMKYVSLHYIRNKLVSKSFAFTMANGRGERYVQASSLLFKKTTQRSQNNTDNNRSWQNRPLYKRCEKCRRVFNCSTLQKMAQWDEHRLVCLIGDSMTSIRRDTIEEIKPPPTPLYVIENGYKMLRGLSASTVEILEKFDICIIDDYVGLDLADGVYNEVNKLMKSGCFSKQLDCDKLSKFRSDSVYWLNNYGSNTKYLKILKHSINNFILSLDLKYVNKITHYTHFQISHYHKENFGFTVHVDNPNDNGCLLSVIFFCNKYYDQNKDGGAERIFLPDKRSIIDVEAKFNRLLVYWSDNRVAHGTCKILRHSFTLSAWYFNKWFVIRNIMGRVRETKDFFIVFLLPLTSAFYSLLPSTV